MLGGTMRRNLVTALLVVAALALAGCSGDEEADGTTTTAASDTSVEEDRDDTTTTVAEVPDEEFADITEEFEGRVGEAGGDLCQLIGALDFSPEVAPANPEQAKRAVDQVSSYLRALAGANGVEASTSQTLISLADDLDAAAEQSGYSLEFFSSQQTAELFQRPEYTQAMGSLLARAEQECPEQLPSAGS